MFCIVFSNTSVLNLVEAEVFGGSQLLKAREGGAAVWLDTAICDVEEERTGNRWNAHPDLSELSKICPRASLLPQAVDQSLSICC